jgi:hypothetical protein
VHLGAYRQLPDGGSTPELLNSALQGSGETARFEAKPLSYTYGQSEKETTSEDVETQTPEAPQGEPPQKAHMAEVNFAQTRIF